MKAYLVGGAVRDKLLGLPVKERDWVVVGATPQEMLKQGFKKVGRDFPVFLHPKTHEEYALARTERKTGKGYTDFVCYSDPSVTLKEDLKRRDLTINAMAQDQHGKIIDPYGGYQDLKKKILRHVSPAFIEDPVRILRLARFASRFGDFKVDPKTNLLIKEMLYNGEVDALVPERVWQELDRALGEPYPERFFLILKNCHVLPKLFPEIATNLSKIKKSLQQITVLSQNNLVRFATIAYSLDKEEIKSLCRRYKIPNAYRELSLLVNKLKNDLIPSIKNTDNLITALERSDAYRKPEKFRNALTVCQTNNKKIKIITNLLAAYEITKKIGLTTKIIIENDKKDLRKVLHNKRREKVENKLLL